MISERPVDGAAERKFFLDYADDLGEDDGVTFILNIHGGGSAGVWQRGYFPAHDYADAYRLVVAAPTALTDTPFRFWVPEADDDHLHNVVEYVFGRFDVTSFWLAGHSQGGMTSNRLLRTPYFAERVDGFLSLSGGRLGQAPIVEDFGPPRPPDAPPPPWMRDGRRRPLADAGLPDTDFSFIFATGSREIIELPQMSPWAERYDAKPRAKRPDIVDTEPGRVHDTRWETFKPSWGREARPGTAELYVYPDARDGRVIADVVRLDKGHTEGLEPKITEELVKLIVSAPGGKARALAGGKVMEAPSL